MSQSYISMIGAGLGGSEAAYQIAKSVIFHKNFMKCMVKSPNPSKTETILLSWFVPILCVDALTKMQLVFSRKKCRLGSVILESAEATRVPAGVEPLRWIVMVSLKWSEKVVNHTP